jgi:hypothetical protein
MHQLPSVNAVVPRSALEALRNAMPEPAMAFRLCQCDAGLGSLGRQWFTAVVDDWWGGILAREAKALAPAAWRWWDARRHDTLCCTWRRCATRYGRTTHLTRLAMLRILQMLLRITYRRPSWLN